MNDVFVMCCGQALGHLSAVLDSFALGQRSVFQDFTQALTLEQLGDKKGSSVVLSDIMDGNNVGMIQGGDCMGFLFKPPQAVGVPSERFRKNLHGDIASQACVAGTVDLSHAARSQW